MGRNLNSGLGCGGKCSLLFDNCCKLKLLVKLDSSLKPISYPIYLVLNPITRLMHDNVHS